MSFFILSLYETVYILLLQIKNVQRRRLSDDSFKKGNKFGLKTDKI